MPSASKHDPSRTLLERGTAQMSGYILGGVFFREPPPPPKEERCRSPLAFPGNPLKQSYPQTKTQPTNQAASKPPTFQHQPTNRVFPARNKEGGGPGPTGKKKRNKQRSKNETRPGRVDPRIPPRFPSESIIEPAVGSASPTSERRTTPR